jgi:hypothetical protein
MRKNGWRLLHVATDREVTVGMVVHNRLGVPATVVDFAPPKKGVPIGRVMVTRRGQAREDFPGIYGLRIERVNS